MSKFKIGDIVKYINEHAYGDTKENPLWGGRYGYITGKIIRKTESDDWYVTWNNGITNNYSQDTIELIENNKKIINKIIGE